jgi:hypothetical protein
VTSIADQPLSRLVLLGARRVFFCPPLDVAEFRGPAAGSCATAPWALGESAVTPPGWTQKLRHQAAHGGEIAVICVSESTVKDVAGLAPNITAVAPVKCLPVIMTDVPPVAGPLFGLRPVINGPSQFCGGGIWITGGPHGGMQL